MGGGSCSLRQTLKLRISEDRGEYGVAISPIGERSEWAKVRDVLTVVAPEYKGDTPYDPIALSEWFKLRAPTSHDWKKPIEWSSIQLFGRIWSRPKPTLLQKMKAEVGAPKYCCPGHAALRAC